MTILSFQSSVAHGRVGHSVSVFALERLGFEVAAINTVQFSNHPGHGAFTGQVYPAAHVAELVRGLRQGGFLTECQAVLSGYLGDEATGAVVLAAAQARPPGSVYLCDPVMGDNDRLYVRPGLVSVFSHQLLKVADIITPNLFELTQLSGKTVTGPTQAIGAAQDLLSQGPGMVVVTGLRSQDEVTALLVTAHGVWQVTTPWIDFAQPVSGTGDLLSALILAGLLKGEAAPHALSGAMSGLFAVLVETKRRDRRELAVVAAQDQLAMPDQIFPALAVGG